MIQKSKIAQLPPYVHEDLEKMLDSGHTEQECAKYLNEEVKRLRPDYDHIVKDGPISQQNVSFWKATVYNAKKAAEEFQKNAAAALTRQNRQSRLDEILSWLTAKLAAEIVAIDRDPPPAEEYAKRLHGLVVDVTTLRKLENDTEWIETEKRRVKIGESRFEMTLKLETHKLVKARQDEEAEARALEERNKHSEKYVKHVEKTFDKLMEQDNAEAALGPNDIWHNGQKYRWDKAAGGYFPYDEDENENEDDQNEAEHEETDILSELEEEDAGQGTPDQGGEQTVTRETSAESSNATNAPATSPASP